MTNSTDISIVTSAKPRGWCALAAPWLLAALLWPTAIVLAQTAQAQSPNPAGAVQAVPQAPPPEQRGLFPSQPAPPERPGFIYAFGRWWDSARGKFEDLTKHSDDAAKDAAAATREAVQGAEAAGQGAANATHDAVKSAAEATKDAATSIFRLPGTRVVEVHQRCAIAPNGAPDCRSAATNACRAKGFADGHPVDVQSSQNCPPAVWMSGREPGPGECPEETVVLMVACQ